MKLFSVVVLCLLCMTGASLASNFDGMSVEQIRNHAGFTPDTQSMSWAANSAEPGAPHIYWWIGYISDGDQRVYFTSYGEALTCVQWDATGEWVPLWVVDALDRLFESDVIVLDPGKADS